MSNKKGRKWDGTSRVKFLLWLMGLAGGISSWAWREHVKILKRIQDIEHEKLIQNQKKQEYLRGLINKE